MPFNFEEADRSIRTLVPHYDEMMATGVALLATLAPPRARVLDLGAGSGRASDLILRRLPGATIELLEIDEVVLAAARLRLADFGGRARFRCSSFLEELPAADTVVASLSLHHVAEIGTKTEVYRRIHAALPLGGLFLCFDAALSRDAAIQGLTRRGWIESMVAHGIAEPAANAYLASWAANEFYLPLGDELRALAAAGFPDPECFWRRGPMVIYGARKGQG